MLKILANSKKKEKEKEKKNNNVEGLRITY